VSLLVPVGIDFRTFRVISSDASAAAHGPLVLRLRFPGVCASCGLLLRRSRVALSFHADDDENQQNSYGNDAEDRAHRDPSLTPE
jgi:hypothetical protein